MEHVKDYLCKYFLSRIFDELWKDYNTRATGKKKDALNSIVHIVNNDTMLTLVFIKQENAAVY